MEYINDIIAAKDYSKLRNEKGESIEQVLKKQAEYLQELVKKHLMDYRRNFDPIMYGRTGSLENSVCVAELCKINKNRFTVYVYFNENALHRSWFGVGPVREGRGIYDDDIQDFNSSKSYNTALLINDGYVRHSPAWIVNLENFGYRVGAHFVEQAVEEFNKNNTMGFYISPNDIITKREW